MSEKSSRQLGVVYKKGELVYQQDDNAKSIYIVQKGKIRISRKTSKGDTTLREIGKGEMFGLASLFTADRVQHSSAQAVEKSTVLKLDEKLFIERIHTDPSISFRVIRYLSQRVCHLDKSVSEMAPKHFNKSRGKKKGKHNKIKDGDSTSFSIIPASKGSDSPISNVQDFSVGAHLLVVEDDPGFFSIINGWISQANEKESVAGLQLFKVTHVNSFDRAEKILGKDKFDLILLDLNLPDSSGIETFAGISEMAFETPVIIFSSLSDEKIALNAVENGAQDYLVKGDANYKSLIMSIKFALARVQDNLLQNSQRVLTDSNETEDFWTGILGWLYTIER
jgi:CheY-like chemotaxis protein